MESEAKSTAQNPTETKVSINQNSSLSTQKSTVLGEKDDKFYQVLFGALEKNNQPGFDYLEFKKALQSLESLIPDEKTKFLSAFAGAKAAGTDANALNKSIEGYLQILDAEASNFRNAVDAQWAKQIDNRENEINQLTQLVKSKTEQISKLQSEIDEHTKMLDSLNDEIGGAKDKLVQTKANFTTTLDDLVKQLRGDKDRINTYLVNQ